MLQGEDQGILDAVLAAAVFDATVVVREYSDEAGNYEVEVSPEDG